MRNLFFPALCSLILSIISVCDTLAQIKSNDSLISDASAQRFSGRIIRIGFNVSTTNIKNLTYTNQQLFLPNGAVRNITNLEGGQATTMAVPICTEIFSKNFYISSETSTDWIQSDYFKVNLLQLSNIHSSGRYNKAYMRDGIYEVRVASGRYFHKNIGIMGGLHYRYQLLYSPNFIGNNTGIINASSAFANGTIGGNQFNTNIFNDGIGGHMPGINANLFYSPNPKLMVRASYVISTIIPSNKIPITGIGHQIETSIYYAIDEDDGDIFGVVLTLGFQSRSMGAKSTIDPQTNLRQYSIPNTNANTFFTNLSLMLPLNVFSALGIR